MKGNEHTSKLYDVIYPQDFAVAKQRYIFLVMEIVEADLHSLLDHEEFAKLDEEKVTLLLYNILSGLRYVHKAGLIHRDLKPANILVRPDLSISICDFGMTRREIQNKNSPDESNPQSRRKAPRE